MPDATGDMSSVEYERLIRNIHAVLFRAEGRETVDVQHNIKLADLHGQKHQIDVFWRFQIAGIEYRTAIECKHYTKPVTKSYVATFALLLSKIGNINGVMVTSAGFQSGAEELAKNCGIRLVIARSPTEEDLAGIVRTIVLNIHASRSVFTIQSIELSEKWYTASGLTDMVGLQSLPMESGGIYDAEGNLIQTWLALFNHMEATQVSSSQDEAIRVYSKGFTDVFLRSEMYGLVPLKTVKVQAETHTFTTTSKIVAPDINSYIMKDIKTGATQWLYGPADGLRLTPLPDDDG